MKWINSGTTLSCSKGEANLLLVSCDRRQYACNRARVVSSQCALPFGYSVTFCFNKLLDKNDIGSNFVWNCQHSLIARPRLARPDGGPFS